MQAPHRSNLRSPSSAAERWHVVHLSDAYLEAPFELRSERTRHMLVVMGVSIVSGALSTLGASFFLLFCYITFFSKFGSTIFFVISMSLVFSLVGYAAVLDTIGPSGDQGNVKALWASIKTKSIKTKAKPAQVAAAE